MLHLYTEMEHKYHLTPQIQGFVEAKKITLSFLAFKSAQN